MKEFIEFIAKGLVTNTNAVEVKPLENEGERERYLLFVEPSDRGKIIGRLGRNIKSFRILVGAAAAKQGRRQALKSLTKDFPKQGGDGRVKQGS